MQPILRQISASFKTLTGHVAFKSWFDTQHAQAGDKVLVNNSFLFRQGVKSNKSNLFPLLEVQRDGTLPALPTLVFDLTTNSDLRLLSKKSEKLPTELGLPDAIDKQLDDLGKIVFILIGHVEDDVVIRRPFNHRRFNAIELQPRLEGSFRIEGDTLIVRDTYDEQSLWNQLSAEPTIRQVSGLDAFRKALAQSLDALNDETYARLVIPEPANENGRSAIELVAQVLEEERATYAGALARCGGDPSIDAPSYNEVLRISYNFASDAVAVVRLLLNVCDLKPIVFWGTVGEHFRLNEAFRELPWLRSSTKPSLNGYLETIGDARNSAFHHLFPFRKTLEVTLNDADLKGISLRIFAEFGRRNENTLRYRDKELVDVLTEFTRAKERRVAPHFWRQNLEVMDATIALFHQTGRVLRTLHQQVSSDK